MCMVNTKKDVHFLDNSIIRKDIGEINVIQNRSELDMKEIYS